MLIFVLLIENDDGGPVGVELFSSDWEARVYVKDELNDGEELEWNADEAESGGVRYTILKKELDA